VDEAAIASSLATKLKPAETTGPAPEPAVAADPIDAPKPHKQDPLIMYRMLDFFNVPQVERDDLKTHAQLNLIFEWGREQAGNDDQLAAMEAIRSLEQRLGLTFRDDDKLASLYRWIRLDNDRRRIERQMALSTANGGL
jgi:hypothetical protein